MKNGSMRLSMFAVMFVACNVVASEGSWEGPLLDIAIEKLVNNFSMEWIERQEDCALVLADFRNNDKDMITFAENFASDLHYNSKNKEPILLCPNKQHDRTIVQDYHWVKVKCYNSNDKDYPCPDNLRNAYYGPNKDKRFLKDSSLVLYLLHE